MEQHSDYVSQLKLEFDSCDSTSSGFLDRDDLTELCRKLRLDTHLPLLIHTLLGERHHARVNFEEFKEGFVAVLSRSLDFSTSEDDSSYLQPVVPEEVKPKLVKGSKRYGRRSHPDSSSSAERRDEEAQGSGAEQEEEEEEGGRRAKLRRSTSLESVESLKSDEETGSQKESVLPDFQSKGVQQEEAEPGGGVTQEVDELLDVRDFQKVLRGSAPFSCSTPLRSADLQRTPYRGSAALEECSVRSTSPSLLTAAGGGQRVLTRLDEGSGCTGPERVLNLWREEGIKNSRDILQTLDFSLEERLSLVDLTLALDNELLVSGNGIHQAALISYKNEIQHLQVQVEQACRQRDKMKADLEQAEQRNLQLVGEVDERHACMETLNHSRIRELQQDFRERVQCVRSEAEQENEALLEKGERERAYLQQELRLLREKELQLEEELSSTSQESRRLEEDLRAVKMKLSEAENSVNKLQRDLDQLLHLKFGSLDPAAAGLSHEERFSQIVKDYELQLRELRDRNDELSSEVELLKNQRSEKKSRRSAGDAPNWTQQHNSDESDMKRGASPPARKKLQPSDKTGLCSLEEVSGPALSIQTELAVEQLKMKHNEDLQQLHIQLETQVNYYERSLEVMRQSMEVERKDISQAFKMEISEVEEQKSQAEQQVKELKEALEKRGRGGGGGWSHEQERKMQREHAELEQNFAREIGNLVKSLRDEKDELEAELQLKMDRETMLLREEEAQRNEEQRAFWENRLDQSEQDKKRLEEQLDQSEQDMKSLKEQLDQSEQDTKSLKEQLDQSEQEKKRLKEQLDQSEQEKKSLVEQLDQSEQEKKSLEEQLDQSEQEKKRLDEQLDQSEQEKKRLEEQLDPSEQEKKRLEEQLAILMEAVHDSHLLLSQSEASTQEVRRRCKDLEEHLKASRRRCGELEEHLKASRRKCEELEEDQRRCEELEEDLKASRRRCEELEEDLKASRRRCEELEEDVKASRRRCEELEEDLKASRRRCEEFEERLKEACRQLEESIVFLESQELLNKRLEEVVRETRSREEEQILHACASSSLTEEKDSLRRDRARLIQDLKEQAMAVDHLQEALDGRRSDEEALQEEVLRLNQENRSYSRLADQLSQQIVEMEEEMRRKEEREEEEKERRKEEREEENMRRRKEEMKMFEEEMRGRQQEFEEAKKETQQEFEEVMRRRQQEFEEAKKETQQHLEEMEALVLALEEVMDSSSPHRTQLEEARSDNVSLQERLSIRQQEVQSLEEEVSKRRRKLEEMESDHERSREEEERLHKENSGYREEVLLLSSRNLQLSNENAELSSLLHGDQESVRMLRERLATVAKEQEHGGATVRRLQNAAQQQQKETMQLQAERKLQETELNNCKEKLERLSGLQTELSSLTLKLQWMEQDKHKLLKEAEERNKKVEDLEAELLRDQLLSVSQERHEHAQEVTSLNRKLQDAQSTLEDLLKEREGPSSLQEENLKLRVQNQELQHKLSELQVRGLELHKLTLEQQNLKNRVRELQEEQNENQNQDQYEQAVLSLQQRTDQLETKLKAVRLVLQEKVSELREQLSKSSQLSAVLQDLYAENAQLMKALQVTEQRQKHAEKKNFQLEDKVSALTKLLRDIVPAALAT